MANTYYINADTGNDSTGNGSSGSPWATLSKANTVAAAGDTIVVQKATATYAIPSANIKALTIQASAYGDAVFDGGGANPQMQLIDGATFSKLIFQNCVQPNASGGLFIFSNLWGGSGTATFNNCTLRNYTITDTSASDLNSIFQSNYTNGSFVLSNCLIYGIKRTAAGATTSGLFGGVSRISALTLTGCTIGLEETTYPVKYIFASTQNPITLTVKNCIIANLSGGIITWARGSITTQTITYSDLYALTGTPTLGAGCITSGPLFVDAVGGNFRVRPQSPCLNTGSAV